MPSCQLLVIEDDDDSREMLVALLLQLGFAATGAPDGPHAIAALRGGLRPSVVLLDNRLPGMGPPEIMAELSRDPVLASLPVILVSGDHSVGRRARELGAQGYLEKPFSPEALQALINRYVPGEAPAG